MVYVSLRLSHGCLSTQSYVWPVFCLPIYQLMDIVYTFLWLCILLPCTFVSRVVSWCLFLWCYGTGDQTQDCGHGRSMFFLPLSGSPAFRYSLVLLGACVLIPPGCVLGMKLTAGWVGNCVEHWWAVLTPLSISYPTGNVQELQSPHPYNRWYFTLRLLVVLFWAS